MNCVVVGAVLVAGYQIGCNSGRESAVEPAAVDKGPAEPRPEDGNSIGAQVATFCGDCHAVPHPDSFPKIAWESEVERGYRFYLDSDRQDLTLPAKADVVNYFRRRAPERLELSVLPPDSDAGRPRFVRAATSIDVIAPAISHLDWSASGRDLVACDMRSGALDRFRLSAEGFSAERLANLGNLAHAARCDLDGDGRSDLVAADLGSFQTIDHDRGRVVWMRSLPESGYEQLVILTGIGRVADVEPVDCDGDGDLDLIVAEFGLIKTGAIHLLENLGEGVGPSRFAHRVLDPRHGASHVPVVDLNQDGLTDFVALISQEHEVVEVFLNLGKGSFQRQTLFAAGDPSFGSSGLLPVDLDQDGDLDLVLSNGDTFDSFYLKPYHGLRWLENTGAAAPTEHHLLSMPGIHRVIAADLDGDGDLDLACVSFIPHALAGEAASRTLDSIVWLEQTGPGRFARHVIEQAACHHVTLEAGDFDGDGDVDLVTGNFDTSPGRLLPALTWWRNDSPR